MASFAADYHRHAAGRSPVTRFVVAVVSLAILLMTSAGTSVRAQQKPVSPIGADNLIAEAEASLNFDNYYRPRLFSGFPIDFKPSSAGTDLPPIHLPNSAVNRLPSPAMNPLPTPTPSKLIYSSIDTVSGKKQIYSIKSDGTGKTNLSNSSTTDDTDLAWSPDGTKIAFGRNGLWVMNADGSNQVNLNVFNYSVWYADDPSWSPDSSRIVLKQWTSTPDLFVINADGTNFSRVTDSSDHEDWMTWSPDGSKIAFIRGNSVYTIYPDGTNETLLWTGSYQPSYLAWSPDGQSLAWTGWYTGELFIINSDGSNLRTLALPFNTQGGVCWSPDSTKIAYSGNSFTNDWGDDVYTVPASGGTPTKLTSLTHLGGDKIRNLAWSADGAQIAYSYQVSANVSSDLYVMNADGTSLVRISQEAMDNVKPLWFPKVNQKPTVSLTAPANNATFVNGANITITATAADADGTVSKVEFFQGATKIGESSTSPYSLLWNNVPIGSYALTAKATDNQTAATVSTAVNITVNASSCFIQGNIKDSGSVALSNVQVRLSGSQTATLLTDASGNYSINVAPGGSYTVTPTKLGYLFAPASKSFSNVTVTQTAQNFVGTAASYTLSGQVLSDLGAPLSNVFIALSGSQSRSVFTDPSGNYSFASVPAGGDYTLAASSLDGYGYLPGSRSFTYLSANQTASFTGSRSSVIKGIILDASGNGVPLIQLNLTGSQTASTTTEIYQWPTLVAGRYSFNTLPHGGNYTVTPVSPNYLFFPASISTNNLQTDRIANFSAIRVYQITGRVTDGGGAAIAGATVTLGGSSAATTTTDATGRYTFTNLLGGGNYLVTVSKTNFIFTPASQAINNLTAITTAYFTGSAAYTISGRIADDNGTGLSAVTVSLSGAQDLTTSTDAGGNYSFAGLTTGGNYWITPFKSGIGFNPSSGYVAALSANQTVNFVSGSLGSVIVNPVADAHVRDGASAAINFGTINPMEVMSSGVVNDGNNRDDYLRFDLSQLNGNVGTVKLRIFASLSAAGSVATTVYPVSNTTWVETTLKWTSKPALGTLINSSTVNSTTNAWYEFDVTNYVKSELAANRKLISLALHDQTASTINLKINSRESTANKPELLISPEAVVNTAPTVNAGPDQTLSLPNAVTLNAQAFDDTPTLSGLTYSWTTISGPGPVTFAAPISLDTTAGFIIPGVYVLQLQASDGLLAATDQVQVTVNAALGTATLTATADALVRDGSNASTNYGTATTLETRSDGVVNSGNNRDAYLKFDTTAVTLANTGSVKLQIYAASSAAGAVGASVYSVATTTWIESGAGSLTWSNKPVAGGTALSSATLNGTTLTWYELDVTNYVKAEKTAGRNVVSLVLHNPAVTAANLSINSKEAASNRPQLVITPPVSTAPRIINFAPSFGLAATAVTINGQNFGATKGTSTITFNGVTATQTTWSANVIVVPVPSGAATGSVVVTVGGVASNGMIFTVAALETDADADGLGDSWERMYFGDLTQTAAGDFDGDGITNLQEYQQGRNPTRGGIFDTGNVVNLKVFTPLDNLQ